LLNLYDGSDRVRNSGPSGAGRRAGRSAARALTLLPLLAAGCGWHDAFTRKDDGAPRTTMSGTDRPLNSTIGTAQSDLKPGRMDGPSAPGVDLP